MPAPVRYRAYGLSIFSELPVPGAMKIGADRDNCAPDLEIVEGPAGLPEPATQWGPYRHAPGRLLFERKGVARYLCEDGRRIVVERAAHASDLAVSSMLIATALPAALWMRGAFVLHAAAAVLPGQTRAIAICGPSQSGKSTILDALVAAGASVVGDDTLCVRLRADAVEASGLPACYFLRDESTDADEMRAALSVPVARQLASAELAAAVILSRGTTEGNTPQRLQGVAALEALIANRHRPMIPKLLGTNAHSLRMLAAITKHVPLFAWSRPQGAYALNAEEQSLLSGLDAEDGAAGA